MHYFIECMILSGTAFIAGTADAIAGGGGLITMPALMLVGASPFQALGTDKLQSAIGELSSTRHFLARGGLELKPLIIPLLFTSLGALTGVAILRSFPISILEKGIPFMLLSVLMYYAFALRSDEHRTCTIDSEPPSILMPGLGAALGIYNGFFGPGTGALWSVALMKWMKFDIKKATMWTKPLNFSANCAAMVIFIAIGNINYIQAVIMGIGSFLGGLYGAKLVLNVSAKTLRTCFILLMSLSTGALFIKYYL